VQLRRDTILYTAEGGVGELLDPGRRPAGFVDPYPDVFARLVALSRMTRRGLEMLEIDVDNLAVTKTLARFDELAATLEGIAVREVEGMPLSEEDERFLREFPDIYSAMTSEVLMMGRPPPFIGPAVVADVQSNFATAEVLEVGSGRAEVLLVMARVPGTDQLFAAAGPVFSYHEFRHPIDDRLTDEQWKEMLAEGTAPPQPAWTCSFRYPCEAANGVSVP
jgi:hypothetical protein